MKKFEIQISSDGQPKMGISKSFILYITFSDNLKNIIIILVQCDRFIISHINIRYVLRLDFEKLESYQLFRNAYMLYEIFI